MCSKVAQWPKKQVLSPYDYLRSFYLLYLQILSQICCDKWHAMIKVGLCLQSDASFTRRLAHQAADIIMMLRHITDVLCCTAPLHWPNEDKGAVSGDQARSSVGPATRTPVERGPREGQRKLICLIDVAPLMAWSSTLLGSVHAVSIRCKSAEWPIKCCHRETQTKYGQQKYP